MKSNKASSASCSVVILAAGQGKRMRSTLPKVLVELAGVPLLFHILRRVREAVPGAPVAIVVGHAREQVENAVRSEAEFKDMSIEFVHQAEQLGTGHAVRCAMDAPWGKSIIRSKRTVLVLPGDLPLISTALIDGMVEGGSMGSSTAVRLLTCSLPDPAGYGRVVRRGNEGGVLKIVEEKDATPRQKSIKEVAASIYLFQSDFLAVMLRQLSAKNAQKEYYLTDLISMAVGKKKRVDVLQWSEHEDLRGVNDPWELALARQFFNRRFLKKLAVTGVHITDPCTTWVDETVVVGEGTRIDPGTMLVGKTTIGKNVVIGPHCYLKDTVIEDSAVIKVGTVTEKAVVKSSASVGPYTHLRPDSVVGPECRIGNFVEIKKSKLGTKTNVSHLSYIGDAEIGSRVNIGCGFVTCNYDGQKKHQTVIEDEVFMGSDCQTVAPVRVGKGAYVASGSTITDDVEPGALAIARSRQVTKPGYAGKLKGGN